MKGNCGHVARRVFVVRIRSCGSNPNTLAVTKTPHGTLTATRVAHLPAVTLPNLSSLTWKSSDSLPEIQPGYSDAKWTVANHNTTINPTAPKTPVVLYAGDYGYHTGSIIWRAHFNATGSETAFTLEVWGGSAFAYSVWLDSTFIGSWEGDAVHGGYEGTFHFPTLLAPGSAHVLTILQDHMGYEEDWTAASDGFKTPRGIVSYSFVGSAVPTVSVWKVTGNLGGENYADRTRGPLNEGGLFGERQGWHLPGFNEGNFYRTTFDLNIPKGVDYPLALVVSNSTVNPFFRSQFYVNGYQFGKYVNNIGPQTVFPVPQGILNYNGPNTLAVSLWALGSGGAKLNSLGLHLTAKVESSMTTVINQPLTAWLPRPEAY
ncbi:putative beta-galactosidase, domain 3 [Lyophyllum shimeji]|uniref:beta-galactosidase n=1 Tax=Lyophyllum shimeji TaxID=47721 RepID=A0A9P3UHS6_LYOSH|nr:putative beta-galactosidase, domain 3 [Lyophyllum shimeji]